MNKTSPPSPLSAREEGTRLSKTAAHSASPPLLRERGPGGEASPTKTPIIMNKITFSNVNRLSRFTRMCLNEKRLTRFLTFFLSPAMRGRIAMGLLCILLAGGLFAPTQAWAQTAPTGGNGSAGSPYLISNSADMDNFRALVNANNIQYIGANIHWRVTQAFTWLNPAPIGGRGTGSTDRYFRGHFDGGGFQIYFNTITTANNVQHSAFFGQIQNATIKNLYIQGNFTGGGASSGGLVGEASGSVTIHNCHVKLTGFCTPSGFRWGGLIGLTNSSSIIDISSSSVEALNRATLSYTGSENFDVGGLIGTVGGSGSSGTVNIIDCMANVNFQTIAGSNGTKRTIGGLVSAVINNKTLNITRCYSNVDVPVGTNPLSQRRGAIIGYIQSGSAANLRTVINSRTHLNYSSSSSLGAIGENAGNLTLTGLQQIQNWTALQVYNELERKNTSNGTYGTSIRGNESWGFAYNQPVVTKTNYIVRVTAGSGISDIADPVQSSGSTYYIRANRDYYVRPNPAPNSRQQITYSFSSNFSWTGSGSQPNFTATPSGSNLTLNTRVDGSVSAALTTIPHPHTMSDPAFNQWVNPGTVSFSWYYNNPSNLTRGRFWVYRRETSPVNSTTWTLRSSTSGISLSTGNNPNPINFTDNLATADFNKTFQYRVAYTDNATNPTTTPNDALFYVEKGVNTTPTLPALNVRATSNPGSLTVTFNTDNRLTSTGTGYNYIIERSVIGSTNWTQLGSAQNFTGQGTYMYVDNTASDPCFGYRYRITINAYNTTFTGVTPDWNYPGRTLRFVDTNPFRASKGEYANYVRLQWQVTGLQGATATYRVYRRVANPGAEWVELETVTSNAETVYWSDHNALTGIFYEYMVRFFQVCGVVSTPGESKEDVGFTQAFGTVSGRVTYGSGVAVQNVNMLVRRNDLQNDETQYRSLYSRGGGQKFEWLAGNAAYFNNIWESKQWALQFWVNPFLSNDLQAGSGYLMCEIGNQMVHIYKDHDDFFRIWPFTIPEVFSDSIPANHFSHVTIARNGDVVTIYTVHDQNPDSIHIKKVSFPFTFSTALTANNCKISFGHRLIGNIDDVRFWSRSLSEAEIKRDYSRRLTGSETGLVGYWTFDDGLNGRAFDMSRVGTVYNGNHATTNTLEFSDLVPDDRYQLALKGITDANGNYQINGIPYTGEGTSYSIVPSMGVHQFNPTEQLRYISLASMVHNGTDFIDISSFMVSGTVVYEGGDYPVEGCTFEIDGVQVIKNGRPESSGPDGRFSFSVPIGVHKVQVKKPGHTFVDDGFLLQNGQDINYNAPLNNIIFENTTRVRLIGHIVGGKREHEKESGFGLRVNNIGSDKLVLLGAQQAYRFTPAPKDTIFAHNTGDRWANWSRPGEMPRDSTRMSVNENEITIHVSPETGEYVAWVYPELYTVQNITAGNYGVIYDRQESLDLRNAPVINDRLLKTAAIAWTDSILIPRQGNMAAHWQKEERTDTVRFHHEWSFFHQERPSFSIQQLSGAQTVKYYGESFFTIDENTTIPLVTLPVVSEPEYTFGKPVFRQGEPYEFHLKAFERYYTPVRDVEDIVPVKGGVARFLGELVMDGAEPVTLDSIGEGIFRFVGGMADLTTGVRELSAEVLIDGRPYDSENFGEHGLSAYLLGGRSTGTDFVTAAGDKIDFILHDPPGTHSYAFIEKGTTNFNTKTVRFSEGERLEDIKEAFGGVQSILLAGMGAMTGGVIESQTKTSRHTESEMMQVSNGTWEERVTFTDRLETSRSPDYVGHMADVFVGTGMNTLYGLCNNITIVKNENITAMDELLVAFDNYSIVRQRSLSLGLSFGTQYYFTTHDIENIMIPKWEQMLRSQFVMSEAGINPATMEYPAYVSKLEVSDSRFGKRNDDPIFGAAATNDMDGPSYKLILPDDLREKMIAGWNPVFDSEGNVTNALGTISFTDSVIYYNDKIKMWERHLAANEERKVKAIANDGYPSGNNISFGGGVKIEKSETHEFTETWENSISVTKNIFRHDHLSVKAYGVGLEINTITNDSKESTLSTGGGQTASTIAGFVLEESGLTDQITVDWRLNDYGNDIQTYMFRTRGGRTSCPYEGEVRTKYFEPGQHIISEATMQIEVPKMQITGGSFRAQVPSTRPAVFMLNITNESETDGTGWFKLTVDESTNPNGAILKIDGMPIANGRFFSTPAGQVLAKTLTIEKGPIENSYENIRLILASDCDPSLSDEIAVSVDFLPSCSSVDMKYPADNWIINIATGDSIQIELDNYNIHHDNFGYVELQYRHVSASQWSSEMKFYYDATRYNNAQGAKTLLSGDPTIKYWWRKDQKQDGEYEFRARTVCETTGGILVSDYFTTAVRGTVDMTLPKSMSVSPSNGILGAGDELSITFNEDIQTGLLTYNNFTISGVLNEQVIAEPNVGIAFAGGAQSARTEVPIFTNGSFSIETWFMREPSTEGTLFAYGAGDNSISLGFNAAGNAVLKAGAATYTSMAGDAIANDRTWKYIAMSYDRDANAVSVFAFDGARDIAMFNNRLLTVEPETQGILFAGNNATSSDGFNGAIAQLHFYGINRLYADVTTSKSLTKSGRENGLIGYWLLDEGEGVSANDKARARRLTLGNAGWYIYPEGRAKQTADNYFSIPTSTYPLNIFSDFTLEFWFRSANSLPSGEGGGGATLFSADNGYIAVNATGGLTLRKPDGTVIQTLTAANLMNTQWHHVAMSVRRNGSVVVYINGANTAIFDERHLGSFASANYYFGARRVSQTAFDNYFAGYFDEIRIWNSALTRDGIMLNKNNKLRGNEPGLQAYYPFEKYVRQSNGLITVTPTDDNIADDGATKAAGGAVLSTTAVSVKDERPEENVPFTFVASSNKIVFTLDPAFYSRVEGVTLNISVSNVRDMRNNRSNTENWTAFVRRNALRWDADPVSIEMQEGEQRSFTARITNSGGTTVNYSVVNLPSWLTVNADAGTLQPLASRDLTFTIDRGANIGNYETAIGLTSGNGVVELLPAQLKVTRQRPDWKVNPHDFESSMNIIGRIQIDGVYQENGDDMLAAFIGELCVGVASPVFVETMGYFTFSDIYGNAQHNNQALTFKLWNASTGRIYPQIVASVENIRFNPSQIIGSVANPVIFNAQDVSVQTIALRTGWNWISTNVLNNNPSILNQMKLSLVDAGELIKGRNAYIQQPFWIGTLAEISEKTMYSVKVSRNHTLTLTGQEADPATTPIAIGQGWNWIGYVPSMTQSVQSALAGLNAQTGDQIKGQTGFATLIANGLWVGSLTHMQPGYGYMYYSYSANPKSLTYQSPPMQRQSVSATVESKSTAPSTWSADVGRYSNTMTMTAIVIDNDVEIRSDQIEIAAFSGTECRGSAILQLVPDLNKYIGFLMVYGEGAETITLKVYDHATSTEHVPTNAPTPFTADAIYGNPSNPYSIVLSSSDGTDPNITNTGEITLSQQVSVYPNPASAHLYISHPWTNIDLVEIIDAAGRLVFRQKDFTDASLDISDMAAGIYLLRIIHDDEAMVVRFVKE